LNHVEDKLSEIYYQEKLSSCWSFSRKNKDIKSIGMNLTYNVSLIQSPEFNRL